MPRGFQVVNEEHKTAFDVFTDEKKRQHKFPKEVVLPQRSDEGSAGYDFYIPKDVQVLPSKKTIVWTDVKAYMEMDEVLEIHIRSSLAIKQGIMLTNGVGIVDASYYGNEGNDGNIGIAVVNTSGKAITLKEGDRLAQGIFKKYLIADKDTASKEKRTGGIGSTGK